jgi:hypothetical protein
MAKWIKETFPLEMPDYYLSQERTKGLVEDWEYEGPRRVAVYINRDTNLLAWNHSYQPLSDKKDPDLQEQQWKDLEIHAGLDKYPVEVTFEKDPLLLATLVQCDILQEEIPLQKEYYWDGREEIHPTDKRWYNEEHKVFRWEKSRDWMYAHSWPLLPSNVIEVWEIQYDPEKKEFVKPYPWKKPNITTPEFLYYYYNLIGEIEKYIEVDAVDFHPDKVKIFEDYRDQLRDLENKFEPFLDKPWMIALPPDPRYNEENFKKVDTFTIMDESGFAPLVVTEDNLKEMADKVNMFVPQGLNIDP